MVCLCVAVGERRKIMNYDILKKNFEKHGFHSAYFETGEEAASYIKEMVKGKAVALGGSVTLQEIKLNEALDGECALTWHWLEPGAETLKKAKQAEVYICSANGVSETGEIVNIDGTGNRVSMTIYGPQKVYYLVGRNKISPDMHSALMRAKNVAAPKNALRLNRKTPCAANGGDRCYDCDSPERICRATVIQDRPCNGVEAEVVFINEDLGY